MDEDAEEAEKDAAEEEVEVEEEEEDKDKPKTKKVLSMKSNDICSLTTKNCIVFSNTNQLVSFRLRRPFGTGS